MLVHLVYRSIEANRDRDGSFVFVLGLALLARISIAGNVADFPLAAAGPSVIVESNDMLCFTQLLCRVNIHRITKPSECPH
ncbi:unnamed protein product, partial [marine sediment metagenome]